MSPMSLGVKRIEESVEEAIVLQTKSKYEEQRSVRKLRTEEMLLMLSK